MMDFIDQKILPFVYGNESLVQQANKPIGEYLLRFSFRFVNNSVNYDNKTNTIFNGKHNSYLIGDNLPTSNFDEIQMPEFNVVNIIFSVE